MPLTRHHPITSCVALFGEKVLPDVCRLCKPDRSYLQQTTCLSQEEHSLLSSSNDAIDKVHDRETTQCPRTYMTQLVVFCSV